MVVGFTVFTLSREMQVPKMLYSLRHEWAPNCMVVSFKLETDESILVKKVRRWLRLPVFYTRRTMRGVCML
jgi:hypothetical protein